MIIRDLEELQRIRVLLTAFDNSTVIFPILVDNQRGRVRAITSSRDRFYAYTNASGYVDVIPQSLLSTYSTGRRNNG